MAWFGDKPKEQRLANLHARLTHSFGRVREDTTNLYAWITHLNNKLDYLHHEVRETKLAITNVSTHLPDTSSVSRQVDNHPGWSHMSNRIAQTEAQMQRVLQSHQHSFDQSLRLNDHIAKIPQLQTEFHEQMAQLHQRISRIQSKLGDQDTTVHLDRLEAQISRLKADMEPLKSQVFESHNRQIEAIKQKMEQPVSPAAKPVLHTRILNTLKRNSRAYAHSTILSYVKKHGKISVQQLREILVEEQAILSKSAFYRHIEEVEEMEGVAMVKEGKNKILFFQPRNKVE